MPDIILYNHKIASKQLHVILIVMISDYQINVKICFLFLILKVTFREISMLTVVEHQNKMSCKSINLDIIGLAGHLHPAVFQTSFYVGLVTWVGTVWRGRGGETSKKNSI